MAFKLLDCVALAHDLPEYDLLEGEVGTIVEIWKPGVFEVEFNTDSGYLVALITLTDSQVRAPTKADLKRPPRPDSDNFEYGVLRPPKSL